MPDEHHPEAIDVLRALDAHVLENTRELRGLRDDLGRIYGRDPAGRLLARAPANGEPAAMPKPAWTPNDWKSVISDAADAITGQRSKRRRRS